MPETDTLVEDVAEVPETPAPAATNAGPSGGDVVVIAENQHLAVRHVIERQLAAGQELSSELLSTATDVTAALVEAIAKALGAVDGGATLPAALSQTGGQLQELVSEAGSRARSAVGDYISGRAVLPNAVVAGIADVTGSMIRAQGNLTSLTIDSAFDIATVAARGGDVRVSVGQEIDELSAAANLARDRVADSLSAARQGIRDAATVASAG